MRAIVIEQNGGPEVMKIAEVDPPRPAAEDVVVRVEAAGLNYIDTYHRGGLYRLDLPFTPGLEGAGTVIEVGRDVSDISEGDRVAWVSVMGSYAEQHVIPAAKAIPLPDQIDAPTAAAVLLQGITAHYLAYDTFPLSKGTRCLIHAGAGGVGLLLTQIAKGLGAVVTTTVGTSEKAVACESAGADHVIVYTEQDFGEAVEDLFGAHALDVVYDGVGAATFEKGLDLLRPRGMMVAFGNSSGPPPDISPLLLAQKGSIFLTRPTMAHYLQTRDELMMRASELFASIIDRSLKVTIGHSFPLERAADAHRALESRATTGKVLILP